MDDHTNSEDIRPVEELTIETFYFDDDGSIPNNTDLPLLIYNNIHKTRSSRPASTIRTILSDNNWQGIWKNGVFSYHHYHSTAHEVLICVRGEANVLFGGAGGKEVRLRPGTVAILPAGTGHKRTESSSNFLVVGGYPPNQDWDLMTGDAEEYQLSKQNIQAVDIPTTDPIYGSNGPLIKKWN